MAFTGTVAHVPTHGMRAAQATLPSWLNPFSRPTAACLAMMRRNDWFCFSVLLLIRAIFRPYVGLVHDAKLYALQVANRASDGFFDGDLFFAFGSQDSYSLVSTLLSPLVCLVGVHKAFIIAYILTMALLIYAEFRLVRLLIGRSWLATFVTVCVVAFDHPYGGRNVFHVHEPFFTARLLAEALTMLGLTLLWQRPNGGQFSNATESSWRGTVTASLLSILALFIHPLMGIGGLAVISGIILSRNISGKLLATIVGLLLSSIVVLGAWGPTVFPDSVSRIDGAWEVDARIVSPHCYVSEWFVEDYAQNFVILGILIAGTLMGTGPMQGISLWTSILGIGSLAVSWLADRTGVELLIAGQAYRGLWLPTIIAIPVAYFIVTRWIASNHVWQKQLALLLIAVIVTRTACLDGWQSFVAVYLYLCLVEAFTHKLVMPTLQRARLSMFRTNRLQPQALAMVFWFLAIVSVFSLLKAVEFFHHMPLDPLTATWIAFRFASPILLGSVGIAIAGRIALLVGRSRAFVAFLVAWVMLNSALGTVLENPAYRDRFHPELGSLPFIKSCIGTDSDVAQTVYWPFHSLETWMELHANAYHEFTQVSGIVFSEEMARESKRRCRLIAKMEVAAMPLYVALPAFWDCVMHYMEIPGPLPMPCSSDLIKLAQDPQLDWIVLPYQIADSPVVTDGHMFVYNCRDLRSSMDVSSLIAIGRIVSTFIR